MAAVRPRSGIFPASSAANATAPPGSTTSFKVEKANRMAQRHLGVVDRQRLAQAELQDGKRDPARHRRFEGVTQ